MGRRGVKVNNFENIMLIEDLADNHANSVIAI